MFNGFFKAIYNIVRTKFRVEILFEVGDHPEDISDDKSSTKPVNVWVALRENKPKGPLSLEEIKKENEVTHIKGITKNAPEKLRQFGATTFEGCWLCVVAEPGAGWEGRYDFHSYEPEQIQPGRPMNFVVTLKPKSVNSRILKPRIPRDK